MDILIVYPACDGKVIVKSPDFSFGKKNESAIRLICSNCGHNKRLDEKPDSILLASLNNPIMGKYVLIGGTVDPYFHLPLWLTLNCCDQVLWAYNYEHLHFITEHVAARLRERNTTETTNKSLGKEFDALVEYKPSAIMNLQMGYSMMFATKNIELIKGGNKSNYNGWVFVMIKVSPTFFTHEFKN